MRTDELRTVLHEHGEEVRDRGASARLDAVHGRVARARRRRAAAAGGGLVAAVLAVALVVVPGMRETQAPVAGDDRPSVGYSKDGVTFPQQVRGRKLLGANVGDPGQSPVYLIADGPHSPPDVRISPICFGPHADEFAVSVSIDGVLVYGTTCSEGRPADPVAAGTSSGPELAEALWDLDLSSTSSMEVRAWLRPRDVRDSEPVTDPEMVVGVGVYGDPVNGAVGVQLPETLFQDGRSWQVDRVEHGSYGEPVAVFRAGRSRQPVQLALGVSGWLTGRLRYQVLVDGRLETSGELGGASGGYWAVVGALEAGPGRDVAVKVTGARMDEARLSLAEYTPVD